MFIQDKKKKNTTTEHLLTKEARPVQLLSSNWDLFFSRKAARYSMGLGGLQHKRKADQ